MHEGHVGGHYWIQTIVKKLWVASYWWPTMQKARAKMCQTYEICECLRPLKVMGKSPLHLVMSFEPFMKWCFDFMGPIKPLTRYIRNQYILVVTNYTTKWVDTKRLWNNIARSTTKFIYEHIITHFECPTHLVSDQGSHFMNNTIKILVAKFITHHKSTTYYPHGNGLSKIHQQDPKKITNQSC